jgi:DNA-binding LytR/AlgR family response regulator
MKALIVDDEPIARRVLAELLEECGGVTISGEASNGMEAIEMIARTRPDVAFLDLQMPGLDGFGVARALRGGSLPLLIFVTAFEQHALSAFETGAVDYLLKPVRRQRLEEALAKARAQLRGLGAIRDAVATAAPPRRIVGRTGQDLHLLDPADIVAFQADGDTVWILTPSGRFSADSPLRTLAERLPSPPFRRIHRSTIINTDHIRRISPLTSKRWLLKLSNGMEATVSKRMASVIRDPSAW